jgi:phytoene dehydrogenase-like protein
MNSPILHTSRRVRTPLPEQVDVAVIGCGLGGLQAAALLARAGMKVACFDSHYVAGGCATMFERGRSDQRFRFDVGLHYLGDCQPGGAIPRLLANAGVADVEYVPMDPEGFDTLVFPGLRFAVPQGLQRYRERLVETFPEERRGIDRYIRFLAEVDGAIQVLDGPQKKPPLGLALHVLLRGRSVLRYQHATVQTVLDDCTRDRRLQAVLLGESGDYAVAPSRASALLHAGLMLHYLRGAWYPVGGGQVLADRLAEEIERHGGTLHLRCGIERVVVEHGRAVGVVVEADGKRPAHTVRAKVVLSNADIKKTFLELVGPEHLPAGYVEKAQGWQMGGALWMTYLGIEGSLGGDGDKRTNFWQFDSFDMESFYRFDPARPGEATSWRPGGCYITSASVKDPQTPGHAPPGHSAVEVMALVPGSAQSWGLSPAELAGGSYRKNPAYLQRKQVLEDDMIARLDALFPGVAQRVVFRESASPASHSRYTRASDGTGYGLAATPGQFQKHRPGYRGPLPGLYLAGASTRAGHGILGALTSGQRAAERIAADAGVRLAPSR